jgi:uncharacterized membrane protein
MEKPAINQQLAKLGELERRILDKVLRRQTVARDTVAEFERRLSFGERLADRIASFGGSWTFIAIFLAVMLAWIVLNVLRPASFDPYPFILLNLVLSCLAALQAPVIMMSQNRMSQKDRLDARHDYEVNLKAEMEIAALHLKLDELHLRQLDAIARIESLLLERAAH